MKGKLITFEGIDGSGKSTIAQLMVDMLGSRAVLTAEPTDSWIGRSVTRALKNELDPITIALLFIADRREHVKYIKNLIAAGKIVICDRFADSTYAYQKEHLKMDDAETWLSAIQKPFIITPDLTFLLKITPDEAVRRMKGRKRIMYERIDFLRHVQDNYLELAAHETTRIIILDASKGIEQILDDCMNILRSRQII